MKTTEAEETLLSERVESETAKTDEIDETKYNETVPYSEVFKNILKTSSMVTTFAMINQIFMIVNTVVMGHANDSNQLAGLGLG